MTNSFYRKAVEKSDYGERKIVQVTVFLEIRLIYWWKKQRKRGNYKLVTNFLDMGMNLIASLSITTCGGTVFMSFSGNHLVELNQAN